MREKKRDGMGARPVVDVGVGNAEGLHGWVRLLARPCVGSQCLMWFAERVRVALTPSGAAVPTFLMACNARGFGRKQMCLVACNTIQTSADPCVGQHERASNDHAVETYEVSLRCLHVALLKSDFPK